MSEHGYTYSPSSEQMTTKRERIKNLLCTVACLAIFAAIGAMLAWRG